MLQQISLLMILVMVGFLCSSFWATEPVETLNQSQALRIKKTVILSFHE
ncbi:MAG TPA: hypothetical protein VE710_14260 [Candidatus Bathyarchaeia archaeon]|nr:hypothetical protein [Candidatus Bathyarchaeia archaeon]